MKFTREEMAQKVIRGEIRLQPRTQPALLPMEERVTSFREVVLGLTERQARAEAQRCLQCGLCSECLACVYACGVNAIDHNMVTREEKIDVGAVILAPGYQAYQAALSREYGFGRYPNVITALQFERLLSASGPTRGHVQRPSDHQEPKRIAFLQCVGSRDQSHDYCSAVCCMYATKEAVIAKEHQPELDVHVFMMDMRAFSKGYWSYFERARDRYGVHYHRCRLSDVREDPATHNLIVRYQTDRSDRFPKTCQVYTPRRRTIRSCRVVRRNGNLRIGASVGQAAGCRTRRIRLLPHGEVQPDRNQPARYLRRGAVPRTEGYPRICRGSEWRRSGERGSAGRRTLVADAHARILRQSMMYQAKNRASACSCATADRTSAVSSTCLP